jgi:hypothetical protein
MLACVWRSAEIYRLDLRACSQRRIAIEVRDVAARALASGCRALVIELRDEDDLQPCVIDALHDCAQLLQGRGAELVVQRHAARTTARNERKRLTPALPSERRRDREPD